MRAARPRRPPASPGSSVRCTRAGWSTPCRDARRDELLQADVAALTRGGKAGPVGAGAYPACLTGEVADLAIGIGAAGISDRLADQAGGAAVAVIAGLSLGVWVRYDSGVAAVG